MTDEAPRHGVAPPHAAACLRGARQHRTAAAAVRARGARQQRAARGAYGNALSRQRPAALHAASPWPWLAVGAVRERALHAAHPECATSQHGRGTCDASGSGDDVERAGGPHPLSASSRALFRARAGASGLVRARGTRSRAAGARLAAPPVPARGGMCVCVAAALAQPRCLARARRKHELVRRPAPVCCAARSAGQSTGVHVAAACAALALLLAPPPHALAAAEQEVLIEDVPSALSANDGAPLGGESRSHKLRGANSKAISNCASKCITTCTRGCVALASPAPALRRAASLRRRF